MNRQNDPVARYYASSTQAADAALSRAERALLFGTEYDGVTPKGVAVIRLCGGVK